MKSLTLARRQNSKHKKPCKNLITNLSNTIKNFLINFINLSCTSSSSNYNYHDPIRSRYDCPCTHHRRQREEEHRRLHQREAVAAEELSMHGMKSGESDNPEILLISDGPEYENKVGEEKDGDNMLSLSDAYALVKSQSNMDHVVEFEDVDEKAERFIQDFREQLRVQKLLSSRARSVERAVALMELGDVDERAEKFIRDFREELRVQRLLMSQDHGIDQAVELLELEDVDEKAEKFIQEFRQQLRIQRLLC